MSRTSEQTRYLHRLPPCPAYDVTGTEQWLSDMAAQGWMLTPDGFSLGIASFERGEARQVTYRLEAVPKGRFLEDNSTPDEEAMELAEAYGWEYVAKRGEFFIYRTERPDARELNTDPRVQALAMKALRARQRGYLLEWVFWLILYPLLRNGGVLYRAPILSAVTLGSVLTLFGAVMITWLCVRAIVCAVMLERRYRRLARGEHLSDAGQEREARERSARRHRAATVARVSLVTLWICLLAVRTLNLMSDAGEVTLDDHLAAGQTVPFATVRELAGTQGEVLGYRQTMKQFGNTVRTWRDPLAPVCVDYCEIAEVTLTDGRVIEGGLYVEYYEAAAPWIAAAIAREHHRVDRAEAGEYYKPLSLTLPKPDFAVAYLDRLHRPTVVLQCGKYVLRASFHPYSDAAEIPLADWAGELANSIAAGNRDTNQ